MRTSEDVPEAISTWNVYKYIADVAVLCICGVDCTFVQAWKKDPSPVAQVSSFYIRVFLLKSKDRGYHNCADCEALWNSFDFGIDVNFLLLRYKN